MGRVSGLVFKVAIRFFVGWLGMTPVCRGAAGINRELLEMSGAAGLKLIGNPAKLERPTSVGFATSAHAKCAFIVAPKELRD